jgi:excinuclease ABC subunit C
MEEVLTRRFRRLIEKNEKFDKKPDVVFIDGGKGQVSAAESVLKKYEIDIPVCGMVKDEKHRTKGLLYNGQEVTLKHSSEGFKLIVKIQNETHRFAVEYHRKLREKKMVRSELDDIKGIGKERRKALMGRFGSIDAIKRASVDDLRQVDAMDIRSARAVYDYFRNKQV